MTESFVPSVLSTRMCHRLLLIPIICMVTLFFVWLAKTDIDMRESKLSTANGHLRSPMDILFSNYRGSESRSSVNTTPYYNMRTVTETQIHDTAFRNTTTIRPIHDAAHGKVSLYDGVDENFLREREKVYSERQKLVEEICHQLGPVATYGSQKQLPFSRLRWVNSRKLIMCFNAKVGTSSWTDYLLRVERPQIRLIEKTSPHILAARILRPPKGHRSSSSVQELLKEYKKIMIVRHPFARIVSAYLEKIVENKFKQISRNIIRIYRPQSSSLKSERPTFEEFVRYVVEHVPRDNGIMNAANRVNIHWRPYYSNCAPCNIRYDVILNMETIADDTRYVNYRFRLGLKEQLQKNHHAPQSSEASAVSFFKKLPKDLILKLYKRYRVDFDMFGYSTYPFLPET